MKMKIEESAVTTKLEPFETVIGLVLTASSSRFGNSKDANFIVSTSCLRSVSTLPSNAKFTHSESPGGDVPATACKRRFAFSDSQPHITSKGWK